VEVQIGCSGSHLATRTIPYRRTGASCHFVDSGIGGRGKLIMERQGQAIARFDSQCRGLMARLVDVAISRQPLRIHETAESQFHSQLSILAAQIFRFGDLAAQGSAKAPLVRHGQCRRAEAKKKNRPDKAECEHEQSGQTVRTHDSFQNSMLENGDE
jgi:hypothetical protein